MAKDESRDRAIRCRYNPTEVGQYVLHIQWTGVHVPGSPFTVTIVDTQSELEKLGDNCGVDRQAEPVLNVGPCQMACQTEPCCTSAFADAPIRLDTESPNFYYGGGSLRMSTLNGDGMFFNDDL